MIMQTRGGEGGDSTSVDSTSVEFLLSINPPAPFPQKVWNAAGSQGHTLVNFVAHRKYSVGVVS
jgi:hypothetical protein